MDPKEIARLCERLSLDDQDGPVMKMNMSIIEDGKEKMELCLVGWVFGNKIVNQEGLGDMAEQVWRTSRKVKVESMGITNFFMFHFGCKVDRQRVLSGGPWTFNNQLSSLLRPQGVGMVSSMDFTKNVPIACRSKNCARLWGELIGKVLDVDVEGPTLRARIVINVTVPLCRGLRVFIDNVTGPICIPVQYEYLPEFCFHCGIIGHKLRECPEEALVDRNGKPLANRYGEWLKAFNLKQWRKARRERKGGPYWSNSSSPSGKSNASGSGGGDSSDGGYEAVQLLRVNQETDFQKSVRGANMGKSLIESPGLDLEIGLHEGSFHGLESILEDTDVGIQKTSILPKSIDVDGAVPELSSTAGRSCSRSGSISKKGKGKSCEETAGVEENSSDSMHKKVENLIFNYSDNVELIKDPMQINKDSNMNSNIILNDNSNVYPINMVMDQDIPLRSLLTGSRNINEGNHIRKARTWKRKIRVSPEKSKSKQKSGKSPPKQVTTSPFMKSLMQT
ncbi:Zinc knuckle CX2CX4HX4C [Parasponia andersonii]|uniref:Zinc knuckle CX2CX4HX4C n=1 Tax=Parasponia andersonii TaxID=3476 RepID=A0A2P5DYI6_PARAD|nr:Zinc knuckle CX2CX4HX4C [Parasponia andersonii]